MRDDQNTMSLALHKIQRVVCDTTPKFSQLGQEHASFIASGARGKGQNSAGQQPGRSLFFSDVNLEQKSEDSDIGHQEFSLEDADVAHHQHQKHDLEDQLDDL